MGAGRPAVLVACTLLSACAGAIVKPTTSPAPPATDAVLVLPGFGYGGDGEAALRSLAPAMAREGMDLYVPAYLSRGGIADGRARLRRFIRDQRLERYQRLHVFAFIAGGWTFNPLAEMDRLPNLATVVYDRSPYQERAPRIADEELHFLTWVRYGRPVFDVARTPYAPLSVPGVKVGLVVETTPTTFVKKHAKTARSYGAFRFECDAFMQRHDDCIYVPLNHDELYVRFADVWPEVLAFVRSGRFSTGRHANATAGRRARRQPMTTPSPKPGESPRRVLATRSARWAIALARWLAQRGVRPNAVSVAGVVFAAAASGAFAVSGSVDGAPRAVLLVVAAASIQLRLLCNLLDGMIAVEHGFKTRTGDIYNDLPDRLADVAILAGAGYSASAFAASATLGWAAAVMALFTAYVRLLAGSLGVTQHFIGPMAKQHRMFTLTLATLLAVVETLTDAAPRAVAIGLALIVAGSVVTVFRRTARMVREVNAR